MIDTTETTGATAPVAEAKPKRTRGVLNKAHLRKLTKAEGIAQAAQNTEHAPALATRAIAPDFVTGLLDDTDEARTKAAEALSHSTAAQTATAEEYKAAHVLLAGMQEVQKAAKQKYARTNRIALGDYLVGEKLNGNRPNLLQTSQTFLSKLSSDTLPGITAAKVTKLRNLRKSWVESRIPQTENIAAAQTARAELRTMLKSIEDRQVAIQLAADAEWPHTDEAHAAIRKEFALSPRQPLQA